MDNWVIELVKILLGGIVGVFLAEAFPSIKSFFKRSSLSLRNKSIKVIKDEYYVIKRYSENHSTLTARSIKYLTSALVHMLVLFMMVSVAMITGIKGKPENSLFINYPSLIGIYAGVIVAMLSDIIKVIDNAGDFDDYKTKVIKQLRKLKVEDKDFPDGLLVKE